MVARTSMADLIARVRLLIRDPAGATAACSDDEIQDALDRYRREVYGQELMAVAENVAGVLTYTAYHAPYGGWEGSPVLRDAAGAVLTPATSDLVNGVWTFAAQAPPVMLTGRSFDLYAAAADLLELRATVAAPSFDFTADGATYYRSQTGAAFLVLARQYRARARPQTMPQIRSDT